jgi:hypothetical protein
MISFASSPSAQPDLVVNVRFCSNIDVTVRGKHEPALLPGTNTWGDLYHAIEAVFSPGVPPVFFSG